jgi:hypothetical protein
MKQEDIKGKRKRTRRRELVYTIRSKLPKACGSEVIVMISWGKPDVTQHGPSVVGKGPGQGLPKGCN